MNTVSYALQLSEVLDEDKFDEIVSGKLALLINLSGCQAKALKVSQAKELTMALVRFAMYDSQEKAYEQ